MAGVRTRVLLVDDSAVLRRLAVATLSGLGVFEVDEAPDAFEALRLMADKSYDVLLVDYYMPGMDGIELVRRVRASADDAGIAIVMITTERDPFVEEDAKRAGVDAFLAKPMEPSELAQVLRNLTSAEAHDDSPRIDAQTILDALPYPALVLDASHNVVAANEVFWRQSGAGISDTPLQCSTYMHPGGVVPPMCPLVRAAESGSVVEDAVHDGQNAFLVSVYPLAQKSAGGEQLFLHLARNVR